MKSLKREIKKDAGKLLVSFLLVTTIIWSLGVSLTSLLIPMPEIKAAVATAAVDMTGGFMRLSQGGDFYAPALQITIGSNENAKTLAAITVSFAGANATTPTWTGGAAASSELLDLAATNGGVSLWKESNSTPGLQFWGTPDTQVTLAASPVYGASNTFTLTPDGSCGANCTLATDNVYYVALRPDSSGVTNGNAFTVTLPANGIATTSASPTIAAVTTLPIIMENQPASIMPNPYGVTGAAGNTMINVRFNKPVQKVGGGSLITTSFTYVDGGGTAQTISSVAHNPGQDFATLTMSSVLDAEDFASGLASVAAASGAIADMSGSILGTSAVEIANPLNITTQSIPSTVALANHTGTPLITFAASGGTAPYAWTTAATADASVLTTLGLSLASNGALTGTVANVPGSYSVNIKVTDSAGTPAQWTKFFNINVAPSGGGGIPGITSVVPGGGPKGAASMPVSITGINTNFSASSRVQFLLSGAEDTNICAAGGCVPASATATSISLSVNINAGAAEGSRDVKVVTGSEQATMPNGFSVFAGGGSELGLLMPTDTATGVQMPPNFSFNPSANGTINSYRITVNTASNFSGTTLWDYTFPKPADINNTNNSHCNSFGCSMGYGEGRFMILTPPTPLAPNTTYYWRVRTYTESPSSSISSATAVESTAVRSFTTTASMSDVEPPNIMHRQIFQATASADLNVIARVMDNLATATTTPALTTKIYFCSGNAGNTCTPTYVDDANHNGTLLGSGYYKFTIPSATIDVVGKETRYYLEATDGTNTRAFKQPDGTTPFRITSVAAGTSNSITGNVKDSNNANLAGVRIFAEGTGFISAQTGDDGNFTLGSNNLFAGTYDLVAIKDGYGDPIINGIPAGSTGIQFMLAQGFGGGFGGDTSKPMVKFTGPMDGMNGIPGNDTNFKIFVAFNKEMSQSKFSESGKMLVKRITDFAANPPTTANITGSWTYYSSSPGLPQVPPESNMAVFALGEVLGDNQTIIVSVTSNITDTAGNSVQGNMPDGSYTFSFTTSTSFAGTFAGGGQFGQGAYMPPHVNGVMPAPGSFDVPTNNKMVINFSDPMADDGSGYVLKNFIKLFTVSGGVETEISSSAINTVVLDGAKLSATVNLKDTYNSGRFAASTSYRFKVLGGAKAANGMTIAPPGSESSPMFTSDFKTGTGADTTAPTVIGSYPNNSDTNVPVNIGAINAAFSKDMNASTISTSTFYLSIGSTAVNGTVEYRGIERQAFFIPKTVLNPNTTYTINVTTSAAALNGQAIATAVARTFTTGSADSAAPQISFINADDYAIAITFSEPMNAAKATDTLNWATSVVNPAVYNIVRYGNVGFNAVAGQGTAISLTSATFNYDPTSNTIMIEGLDLKSAIGQEIYLEMDINGSVPGDANVSKDLSGNKMTSPGNVVRATIQNSQTTKGALGPMAMSGSAFGTGGGFVPTNFSSTTFGFAPPVDVKPFNMTAGQTTIYGIRLPISRQITAGGSVVLTFPTGFDVSTAQQDINSPMRSDLNGPGTGAVTFKCQTNVAGGKACPSSGGSTVTGDAAGDTSTKGGLADDGIVVNASARTVTVYLSADTNSEGHDFLSIDVSGVKNSTVPKDFNTSGYTVDIKTKNGETVLESLTSMPFFIQTAGSSTLTGTITATGATSGTMKVYLGSPMAGAMEATSSAFSGGSATYTFSNLSNGEYMLFTDPNITLGATDYDGKQMPERVWVSGATTYDFAIINSSTGTNVTISIDGPSAESLDIFAGSPTGFKVKQVTLDSNAGAQSFTINLGDGKWNVGVGPQMPKGPMAGPAPAPSYLPPKPVDVTISGVTVTESSGTANDGIVTFTLTSSDKTIRGIVKDGAGKVMANAEVYGYSPNGGFGTHAQSDSAGNFTLNVVNGSYVLGSFVPGMPSSKEVPVTVNSDPTKGGHATNYLFIDGATTGISPTTAAATFILKVAKPDYTISGKITDGTNVVQGASVYAYRTDGPGHANANTDSSGGYTLYVSSGAWNVGSFLPQYGQLTEQSVTISASNATNINFSPTQTGTFYEVSGRAYKDVTVGGGFNGSDVALQGVFVRLTGNSAFNETATGSDGQYNFKVRQGSGYILKAFAPGMGELPPLASFDVSGNVTGKDFAVTPPSTVTFTLSASVAEAFIDAFSTTGMGSHAEIRNGISTTMSLQNGSYKINAHIPGANIISTDIAATVPANTAYTSATGILTVDGNEGLTITLPTLRTVSGTVTDGTNNIAGAWVEIGNPTTGVHFGTQTDTNGAFSLKVANSSSNYFINAMKPGYFREATTLTVNAAILDAALTGQSLTISLATTTISGNVYIGATGTVGAPNAFVRAEKQGGGFSGTQADANGVYSLPVNAGTWKVYAVAEGYAEAAYTSNPIVITSTSATGVNVRLTTTISMNAPKSKPITPSSGGTLEDTTSGIKLTIPANALGTSTSAGNIQAKETNNVRETSSAKPVKKLASDNTTYVNAANQIQATDSSGNPITTLNDSVTVEMTYTKAELAATASADDSSINTKTESDKLKMAYWDETTANWVTLPSTITYKNSSNATMDSSTADLTPAGDMSNVSYVMVSAPTTHFSLYAPVSSTSALAPSTPTGLAATAVSSSQINLTWTQVSGATSYDIYRSAASGGTFSRLGGEPTVSSGSTTSYSDSTGLSANTAYYYKISALNSSGESAASGEVSATTSAGGGGGGGASLAPAPTGSVSINAGAESTASVDVTLAVSSSTAAKMAISNTADFTGISWETYAATKAWKLTDGNGVKTVYAKFMNSSGIASGAVIDTITLTGSATTAPATTPAASPVGNTPSDSSSATTTYPEGTLIKSSSAPEIYVIKNGNKVWIPTAEAFKKGGYKWSDVKVVSADILKSVGSVTLVKIAGDPRVYVVRNNIRKHIRSAAEFNAAGYRWSDISIISKAQLDAYSEETATVAPAVILYRASGDPKVYAIINNAKKHIKSADEFNAAGYRWSDIQVVDKSKIDSYADAAVTVSTSAGSTAVVTSNWLRVRSINSVKGKILGSVVKGESYSILEESGGWYKIKTKKGATGWISGAYAIKK